MTTHFKPWMLVSALLLSAQLGAHAQETLGGLGAASAAGASLGAAGGAGALAAGSRARTNIGNLPGSSLGGSDLGSEMGGPEGMGGSGGLGSGVPGANTPTRRTVTPPTVQSFNDSGSDIVRELLAAPSVPQVSPDGKRRSPRASARYARRTARQTKAQRTRAVQSKYKIPPVSWRAAYLPQDRYKFGKTWKFVSTEDDRFYYEPSAMARKRFNPNRVIGFNSYQDALWAGYRPDPVSKPAPGAQIAYLARLYRGPELYDFVEYVYAGQLSAQAIQGTYAYAQRVERTLRPTRARPYIGSTVAKILAASLNGDYSSIPTEFTSSGPVAPPPPVSAAGGEGMMGSSSGMMGSSSGMSGASSDPRMMGGSSSMPGVSSDPRMMGGSSGVPTAGAAPAFGGGAKTSLSSPLTRGR